MEADLNELHNLANTAFQNISNLTPALRHLVANAKVYQKSVQATCNLAVMFIESLQTIATAAAVSEGSTKKLGDVLLDIMDAFKEIENMKLELTKLFINEIIIPLESKAENEINNTKTTFKSYNQENKIQTELVEKARAGVAKIRKKSVKKKKPSPKLEEKEKSNVRTLDDEESKLKKIREEGLRKALIEERRMYCFVAERMCSYGRGMVVYNNRISNFVNQKLPDWNQYISKPTELPTDSESIISNPTGYKMGTVKCKISKADRKESIKRGKSFNSHFPTKYSTMDGRTSRGGSRPSLSAYSFTNGTTTPATLSIPPTPKTGSHSPKSRKSVSPSPSGKTANPLFPTPPQSVVEGDDEHQPRSVSTSPVFAPEMTETPVGLYVAPVSDQNVAKSEYANLLLLNKDGDFVTRSQSFSVSSGVSHHNGGSIDGSGPGMTRTESAACELKRTFTNSSIQPPQQIGTELSSKLAMIQSQLNEKLNKHPPAPEPDNSPKQCLRALYKHEAQDASQLSFEKDDIIIPVCDQTSGWQYGENEKTKKSGWFPAAFTEDVVVTSNGETATRPSQGSKKAPPVMAKKASRRKISVAGTALVQTSRASKDYTRSGSFGDIPHLPTSSSVPEMIHSLGEQKGHERKHSNSLQGIDQAHNNVFGAVGKSGNLSDSSEIRQSDDSIPPPPPPPPDYDFDYSNDDQTINGDPNSIIVLDPTSNSIINQPNVALTSNSIVDQPNVVPAS